MSDVFPGGVPDRPPELGPAPRLARETILFITLLVVGLLAAGIATVVDRRSTDGEGAAAVTSTTVSTDGGSTSTIASTSTTGPETTSSTATPSTVPGATTTTVRPPTTTTAPPATTTVAPTTTTPRTFPECSQQQLSVTVGASRLSFVVGEAVRANAVVRNISSNPCYLPEASFVWLSGGGEVLCCGILITDCFGQCPPNFFPGQVQQSTACWDQKTVAGATVEPGSYSVGYRQALGSFQILPALPEGPPPASC